MTNKTNVSTLNSLLEGVPTNAHNLKCIELVKYLNFDGFIHSTLSESSDFDNVLLLEGASHNNYDTILVWRNDSDRRYIYLGHWNDGVVRNE